MVDERTPLPRDFQFILAEVTCRFRASGGAWASA